MKKRSLPIVATILASLLAGCTSVQMVGYGDGWVKTSTVSYSFEGPPLLRSMRGQTYYVSGAQDVRLSAFEDQGMRAAADQRSAAVTVQLGVGEVTQGAASAGKIGGKWYPAFEVTVPYDVVVAQGRTGLASRTGEYSDLFTFTNFQSFETREEAVGAMDTIRKLGAKGVEEKASADALAEATRSANNLAASLFEERHISMEVPVVRTAAGVDLESAYLLLAEAEFPEEVQNALLTYERMGMSHRNEDGTANNTANYGVACGIAASKLLLRDLHGSWEACQLAARFEPDGREVDDIRRVIWEQEKVTGVRVLPEEDRKEIERAEELAATFQTLLGGGAYSN